MSWLKGANRHATVTTRRAVIRNAYLGKVDYQPRLAQFPVRAVLRPERVYAHARNWLAPTSPYARQIDRPLMTLVGVIGIRR